MDWSNLHRFFVRAECICEGRVVLDGPEARQICTVLRLGQGDHIAALDGSGCALVVRITKAWSSLVEGDIIESCPIDSEPLTRLTLVQSLPKSDKLEFIIQKGTELGVMKFITTTTDRTVARPDPVRLAGRLIRWQSIAKEAAEQSCRAVVPEVVWAVRLQDLISSFADYDLVVCLWECENNRSFKEILNTNRSSRNILVIVGPEGGLTEEEVRMVEAGGAKVASLGKRVLRSETAAIAAAAIVFYELG